MDSAPFNQNSSVYDKLFLMKAIKEAVSGFGPVDWCTVRTIAKNKPQTGDLILLIEKSAGKSFFIHFQHILKNQSIIQYHLYKESAYHHWIKVGVDFKSFNC